MKLALVTAATSGVGDFARQLVPHLARGTELRVFVDGDGREALGGGVLTEPVGALLPREHDQLLFLVANEAGCGFMAEAVRLLGGAVVLRDWELAELALAAYPTLRTGGPGGYLRAVREGGLGQARQWARDRAGVAEGAPTLNRSIVRFADAFIVGDDDFRERILVERNAPTPVAVMDPRDPEEAAEQYLDVLERFPRPRSSKKRLLLRRVRSEMARRR